MKKLGKNNKGFSLVELIVVVLIMAIIAVALAPQVMKWVNNARISTDIQTGDSVVSYAQLALTDKDAYAAVTGLTAAEDEYIITVIFDTDDTTYGYTIQKETNGTAGDPTANDAFVAAFCEAAGITTSATSTDDNKGDAIKLKTKDATVTVKVSKDGKVTKTSTGLTSADLD